MISKIFGFNPLLIIYPLSKYPSTRSSFLFISFISSDVLNVDLLLPFVSPFLFQSKNVIALNNVVLPVPFISLLIRFNPGLILNITVLPIFLKLVIFIVFKFIKLL